jgi:hypothetical protein
MNLQKGDLVYLPSDIMIFRSIDSGGLIHDWVTLDTPAYGVMVETNYNNENVYHRIHTKGSSWFVRTIDAFGVADIKKEM